MGAKCFKCLEYIAFKVVQMDLKLYKFWLLLQIYRATYDWFCGPVTNE